MWGSAEEVDPGCASGRVLDRVIRLEDLGGLGRDEDAVAGEETKQAIAVGGEIDVDHEAEVLGHEPHLDDRPGRVDVDHLRGRQLPLSGLRAMSSSCGRM